jgi:hypothetical protein
LWISNTQNGKENKSLIVNGWLESRNEDDLENEIKL